VKLLSELRRLPKGEPAFIPPMLAKLVGTLPTAGEWLTELKLDGYRALAIRDTKQARLISRNANKLSAITRSLLRLCKNSP
jgi:ATP-dependent DNA ligase